MLLSEKEKDRKIAIVIGNLRYEKREIFFLLQARCKYTNTKYTLIFNPLVLVLRTF
jgi:hypothetical protein